MKYIVSLNGKNYEVDVEKTQAVITGISDAQAAPVPAVSAAVAAPAASPAAVSPAAPVSGGMEIKAPMPGTIVSVEVAPGQSVKAGDIIMILEAMKMENDIVAPVDGVIKQILVNKGASVNTDEILAVI